LLHLSSTKQEKEEKPTVLATVSALLRFLKRDLKVLRRLDREVGQTREAFLQIVLV